MAIVVDASAVVDVLIASTNADRVGARFQGETLHAPVSIDAEFLHALRRLWLSHAVDDARAADAVALFRDMLIERHSVADLVERMWSLRRNVTSYDAGYVALAERLDLPLVTSDKALSRSSGHAARIEYID